MISDNETPSCFLGSCLKLLLSFDLGMLQLRVIYYSILLVIDMDVWYKKMKIVCWTQDINYGKLGFWQFWDVQSSGSTAYITNKYKNIQNNLLHGRLISTITEAENSLVNSGHQLWQDNIQKPGFWQFWDVQSSGSTMYIPDKYKNIQNNVSHGRLISTITEAKHIFLYKRRPHSNPHPSAPNWQIWCMVCTGLKGHNSNQKTLELKCTKECRSRVAQGLKSPWSQQQGNPHGWCSNCSHCPRTSCTKESI